MISAEDSSWISYAKSQHDNEQDGLVPTTISDTATSQHSDDNEFYHQFSKSDCSSPHASGTSTPIHTANDLMEEFMMLTESWQDPMIPIYSAPPTKLEQGSGLAPVDEQYYNQHLATVSGGDSSESGESSEDGRQEEESLPAILRRPVKGMSNEEKKLRRRELNRLAAQRSRQKKKTTASTFEKEVQRLTDRNAKLRAELETLEASKTRLYDRIKNHFKACRPSNNNNATGSNFNNRNDEKSKRAPAVYAKLETSVAPSTTASHSADGHSSFSGHQVYAGVRASQGFASAFD